MPASYLLFHRSSAFISWLCFTLPMSSQSLLLAQRFNRSTSVSSRVVVLHHRIQSLRRRLVCSMNFLSWEWLMWAFSFSGRWWLGLDDLISNENLHRTTARTYRQHGTYPGLGSSLVDISQTNRDAAHSHSSIDWHEHPAESASSGLLSQ